MDAQKVKIELTDVVSKYCEGTEFFLVDIHATPTSNITVFVDGKTNITIEKCAELSRHLEHFLESNGLVGEKYILEVSSPGMDSPLRVPQQYEKAIGKEVDVLMLSGEKHLGILTGYDDIQLILEKKVQGKTKKDIVVECIALHRNEIKTIKKYFSF
jgi:ribosome maturation factor RimP